MMSSGNLKHIGHIRKAFGYKGELIIEIVSGSSQSYEKLESAFLDLKGARIPFIIESLSPRPDHTLLIKFKQIANREEAIKFLHCPVYVNVSQDATEDSEEISYEDLPGFLVRDVNYGDIGILDSILEYPEQDLFCIHAKGKEVLVPIVDDFIIEVDAQQKIIVLQTPPGLIDLYLSADA